MEALKLPTYNLCQAIIIGPHSGPQELKKNALMMLFVPDLNGPRDR